MTTSGLSSSASIVSSTYRDGPSIITLVSTSYVSEVVTPTTTNNWNSSSSFTSSTSSTPISSSYSSSGTLPSKSNKSSNHVGVVVGCSVAIPVGVVLILIGLGIFLWKRHQRSKRIKAERMQEVEEYGFNPNQPSNFRSPNRAPSTNNRYRGWNGSPTPAAGNNTNGRPVAPRPSAGAGGANPPAASQPGLLGGSSNSAGPIAAATAAGVGADASDAANTGGSFTRPQGARMVRPIGNPPDLSASNEAEATMPPSNGSNFSEGLSASPFESGPAVGAAGAAAEAAEHSGSGSDSYPEGPLATIPESDSESMASDLAGESSYGSRAALSSRSQSNLLSPTSTGASNQPNYSPFADNPSSSNVSIPRSSSEARRLNLF